LYSEASLNFITSSKRRKKKRKKDTLGGKILGEGDKFFEVKINFGGSIPFHKNTYNLK